MGRPGAVPGSGLSGRSDVVRRMQATLPILREPLEAMITGLPRLELSLPLHGWMPVVVDGTSTVGETFPLLGPSASMDPIRDSLRSPSACVSRLRRCFGFPAITDNARCAQPETYWFKPTGQGDGCAFGSGCIPSSPICLSNRCELVSTRRFYWLGRP
jgi:hypothetical protein